MTSAEFLFAAFAGVSVGLAIELYRSEKRAEVLRYKLANERLRADGLSKSADAWQKLVALVKADKERIKYLEDFSGDGVDELADDKYAVADAEFSASVIAWRDWPPGASMHIEHAYEPIMSEAEWPHDGRIAAEFFEAKRKAEGK